MKVLDLFSGIGAFSLGLERTGGFRTAAFCEIDPFARRVLAKHWPDVRCYQDVRQLTAARLAADGISVDVICGGFPCQDISVAGCGAGITGERSGLWSEFARLIGELRPSYIIVENVAALLVRGLDRVLGDLAALRYDAEWHCIPASAVGAPHRRDRVWIVAHPAILLGNGCDDNARGCGEGARAVPEPRDRRCDADVADAIGAGLEGGAGWIKATRHGRIVWEVGQSDWWLVEPDVGRVAHGVAKRVDRLRGLGNALVPQIPQLIGTAILRSAA